MNQKEQIKQIIQSIILSETRPIPKGILMEKTKSIITNISKNIIYDCIDELINENKLKLNPINNYVVEGYINQKLLDIKYQAKISINSLLDGNVIIDNDNSQQSQTKYFIHHSNLMNALDGDLVEINLMDKYSQDGTQHAIVNRIIERTHNFGVGTYRICGKNTYVDLDDHKNYLKIKLEDETNLVNGHKLLLKFNKYENDIIYASVSKIIGHISDVGNDILSIVYENGIEPEFKSEIIDFVNNFKLDNNLEQLRTDLSHLSFITIDPSTSKDLDDSFYLEQDENKNYVLYVAIADVSVYVPYKSILDKLAIKRSTSIYLVDRVIPMLPHKLCNDDCSLNANELKRTITCKMIINQKGEFENIEVLPTLIKSKYQLSYDEVNDFFNTKKASFDESIQKLLVISKQLHHILRDKKNKEGYIELNIKEPQIIIDQKGWPIDIKIKQHGTAQMMIEDFMVCANNAVSIIAQALKIPFIYRIHERPSIEKLQAFKIEAYKRNIIVPNEFFIEPTPLLTTKIMELNKDKNQDILSKLLLKCMSKAIYSTQNKSHFGLAINDYTHFTSPIRRYPDLIVHRLFWMFYFAKDYFSNEERESFKNELYELCENCTNKEIKAVSIEREVNQLKFCQYMSRKINNSFNATISAIKSFGIFIELENTIEGLVRIKNIGGDYWMYDNEKFCIRGKKTNKEFNFGDQIKVKLINVDLDLKQINFEIVGYEKNKN